MYIRTCVDRSVIVALSAEPPGVNELCVCMEMTHDDCGRFEYNSDLQINDIAKRKSNVTGILETDGPTMLTRNVNVNPI